MGVAAFPTDTDARESLEAQVERIFPQLKLNVYFPSWVHRISYNQTGRLSSVGQHRCQGHPRATALPFGPRGPKSTGSPEGVLQLCPRGPKGAGSQKGDLQVCPRGPKGTGSQEGSYHFARAGNMVRPPPGSQCPLARTGKIGRPPPGSQHPRAGAGQGLPWHLCWPTGANARLRLYDVRYTQMCIYAIHMCR